MCHTLSRKPSSARPQRDNVIVALPFHYQQADLEGGLWIARAAMYTLFAILAVNAVSFFGGFSTFDTAQSLFRAHPPATPRPPHTKNIR